MRTDHQRCYVKFLSILSYVVDSEFKLKHQESMDMLSTTTFSLESFKREPSRTRALNKPVPSPRGYCTEIHCYSQWGAQKLKLDPKGQLVGSVGRRQQGGWVRDSGRHSRERQKKEKREHGKRLKKRSQGKAKWKTGKGAGQRGRARADSQGAGGAVTFQGGNSLSLGSSSASY